tara:strand:+ start:48 stop:428 length:381 start_codon:yes stop_codon:yes gene_type:complete
MPSKSKIKGNTGERNAVKCVEAHGLDAKRAYGSNGNSIGHHEEVDVLINNEIKVQVKVRKTLPKYLIPTENVDIVVFKQDRGKMLVLMDFDDYLVNYKRLQEKWCEVESLQDENKRLQDENYKLLT